MFGGEASGSHCGNRELTNTPVMVDIVILTESKNHLGNKCPGMSVREFLVWVN